MTSQRYLLGFENIGNWTCVEFQEEVPEYRICSLCGAVPAELYWLKCSHVYCPRCLDKLKDGDSFVCPSDNSKSSFSQVHKDTTSANILQQFQVACPNKPNGCDYKGQLCTLKEHIGTCGFHGVQCGVCGREVRHQDLSTHLKVDCQGMISQGAKQEAGEGTNVQPKEEDTALGGDGTSQLKEKLDEVRREVQSLKQSFNEFDNIRNSVSTAQDTIQKELKKMREDAAMANKRIVTKIDKIQHDMKERIEILEEKFRTSRYIWAVKNFSKLKEQALEGKVKSFFSEDFYVGIQGYKMYLGAHFGEKDKTNKTCLSVYMYITKGPYDPTLEWPYRRRSTFVIVDQKNNKNHKVVEIIPDDLKPDLEHCFQRPKNGENEGIGYTAIISLDELEEEANGYINQDSFTIHFITSDV